MNEFPPNVGPVGPDDPLAFDLELLIRFGTALIAERADFGTFMDKMALHAPSIFRGRAADSEETEHGRRVVNILTRQIWSYCPHPAHRYAPAQLPPLDAYAPCHCGSLRKYKQCCAVLERDVPPLHINWLPHLMPHLPRARWKELVGSLIASDMLIDLSVGWLQAGRFKDIVALFEPWFVDDAYLLHRYEPFQDQLFEAYTALGNNRKKKELLDRAIAHGDNASRSSAQQRRATMLADEGDFDAAWELFRQAQRAAPDDPSLSHLEVVLLMSSGREAEARERARFWIARLSRRNDPRFEGLIEMLRAVAAQGSTAMLDIAGRSDPDLAKFRELWSAVPEVASLYTLKPMGDSAGPLMPQPGLGDALAAWRAVFADVDYSPVRERAPDRWDNAGEWLGVLERNPSLWNAFEVLDGLVQALVEVPVPEAGKHLALPVLERAELVLREVLRANRADGLKLEWGWQENRSALNMLGQLIVSWDEDEDAVSDTTLARTQWLVETLNPEDNQGLRIGLMRAYLLHARFDDAIALSDRYPDDFASIRYDRALALYAAGRVDEAAVELRDAARQSPVVLKYLLSDDPKPIKSDGRGVRIGGGEEAWVYRQGHLALWQRHEALEWARSATGRRKRAKPQAAPR